MATRAEPLDPSSRLPRGTDSEPVATGEPSITDLMVVAHADPKIHALLLEAKRRTFTTPAVRDEPEDFERLRRFVTGG
jgi:hypothetical protein